ncbi:MAG: hypothetical protein IJA32_06545 [Lachnospiraceae bacterium]|nr:hypothetical protein [Lachnospiraceae bacterium]
MEEILAVTKHSINSDLNTPLNEKIEELLSQFEGLSQEEKTLINSVISKLDNSTYGLSALKTILNTIKTNTSYVGAIFSPGTTKTIATLISSDTIFYSDSSYTTLGNFVAPLNGTVTVSITVRNENSYQTSFSLKHTHYIEGVIYTPTGEKASSVTYEKVVYSGADIGYYSTITKTFNISVEQGKPYYIKIISDDGDTLHVDNLTVTANISKISG